MKQYVIFEKIIVFSVLILSSFIGYGQRIQQDIFDDLIFKDTKYEAKLHLDIFDSYIFTDSNANKIEFNQTYLENRIGDRYTEYNVMSLFFQDLILDYRHISGYEATYTVDIFGELSIVDNQGKAVKVKKDIFGNLQVETTHKAIQSNMSQNLAGDLVYRKGKETAELKQNLNQNRIYTDSNKTRIEFPSSVWEQMLRRHQTEFGVFSFLIHEFLLIKP